MYKLGPTTVKTKAKAQEYAKTILYKNEIGSDVTGKSLDYMLAYFRAFHHEWQQKKGLGVAAIRRQKEPNYGKYRAFKIVRTDESEVNIAYIINNIQRSTPEKDFRRALRQLIKPQINAFREEAFKSSAKLVCPLTGELVTIKNCHVDHLPPTFEKMISVFVRAKKITDFAATITAPEDGRTMPEIIDKDLARDFYYFHFQNARLRILSRTGNLSIAKK